MRRTSNAINSTKLSNRNGDALGQKTLSGYAVAEKTLPTKKKPSRGRGVLNSSMGFTVHPKPTQESAGLVAQKAVLSNRGMDNSRDAKISQALSKTEMLKQQI